MKKLFNNEAGVSPIVATLVLVVVAIAGAAAVGTIMGSFSSDVSNQASAEGASAGASTELLIAGSTTVQPVSELLAEAFMKENSGVKVVVQAGGSGAGISGAEMDVIDIGSASEDVNTVTEHPDLQKHQIGASAVVVIANNVAGTTNASLLKDLYDATDADGKVTAAELSAAGLTGANGTQLFQRAESSGTEDTFSEWLADSKSFVSSTNATGRTGNAGVLKAVEDTTNSIGFVDFGFAEGSSVTLIDIGAGTVKADVKEAALDTLKGDDNTFPEGMTRPLNYLTNGAPSTLEQSFIDFATQPAQKGIFGEVGYFSMYDFA
ncbi:MAG: substrate-binding domain-containing protein [Methanolobus sp.]|nr:substrate-binding domain-containing protein [Methanolobus sp.]